MKVTKNILREIIEAEIKEAQGRNPGALPDQATSVAQQADAAVDATYAEGRISDADRTMLTDYFAGGTTIIKRGARGDKVEALQRALLARLEQHGFSDVKTKMGAVDGQFGGGTEDAVKKLQDKYEITNDGVVGRQTWTAIESDGDESAESSNVRTRRSSSASGDEVAAQPTRPSDLGASFQWREQLQAWFSERTHEYGGESYDLWIRKDGKDFHTNGSIGLVELSDFPEGMEESKSLPERLGMILSESLVLIAHDSDSDADTKADAELFQSNERPFQNASSIPGLEELISFAALKSPDHFTSNGQDAGTQYIVTLDEPVAGDWERYIYRGSVNNEDDNNIWFYDDSSGNHKRISIDDESVVNQIMSAFDDGDFVESDYVGSSANYNAQDQSSGEDSVAQEMSDDLVVLKDNLKDFFELIELASTDQQGYINKVKQTNKETRDFEEMGNLHRNLKVAFEESFATLLDQDFGKDNALFIGGNMDDDEKVEFTAQNKWADLRKNNLTKGQLTARLDIDGTRWHASGLDTAWTKFVSGALAPRVQNFRIIDGTKAVDLVGHEQIIIARDALAIIKQFIIDANIPVTESLSYDRFQKLAGILKG